MQGAPGNQGASKHTRINRAQSNGFPMPVNQRGAAIQRMWCCFGCCDEVAQDEEKKSLISSGSEIRLEQPAFLSLMKAALQPGQDLSASVLSEWTQYQDNANGHPVFYKIGSQKVEVIATTSDRSQVVATSSLTYSVKHDRGDYISFTNFNSDPPFSGLGAIVLRLLKKESKGLPLEPSGPIPGAYSFYEKQGFPGFVVDQGIKQGISQHLQEKQREMAEAKRSLHLSKSRDVLKEVQAGITEIETRGFRQNSQEKKVIYYTPPKYEKK